MLSVVPTGFGCGWGETLTNACWFGIFLGLDVLISVWDVVGGQYSHQCLLVWDVFGVRCVQQCLGCGWGAVLSLVPHWFGMWLGRNTLSNACLVWDVVGV